MFFFSFLYNGHKELLFFDPVLPAVYFEVSTELWSFGVLLAIL